MPELDIAHRRLYNQRLSGPQFSKPEDVVSWFCAVQSQDYPAAAWALGLRGVVAAAVEQAFTEGTILRTHVMRPTWHFVAPADIKWLLALTGSRVNALNQYIYGRLELDAAVFVHSNDVLARALEGGKQLTRPELGSILQQAGIDTSDSLRLTHIVMQAELDAVVCSGAKRGKQFTYALLDERAPRARVLERDEALAEIALRYFRSHGPAQVKDLVWWSGLTTADVKAGIEMASHQLQHETIGGQTYWFDEAASPTADTSSAAYLLPNFDEYTVAYRDRSALVDPSSEKQDPQDAFYLGNVIVIDGKAAGSWKRTFSKGTAVVTTQLFTTLNDPQKEAIKAAADQYGAFLGMPVILD